jgi:hypothetical protein
MGGFQRAREFALSLPGASEEPHFDMSSFRVKGKIFATVPPGEKFLHLFVDEAEAETYVAEDPAAFAPLLWGQRTRGLRVNLAAADDARLEELIEESWRRKAPKRLLAGRDIGGGRGSAPAGPPPVAD